MKWERYELISGRSLKYLLDGKIVGIQNPTVESIKMENSTKTSPLTQIRLKGLRLHQSIQSNKKVIVMTPDQLRPRGQAMQRILTRPGPQFARDISTAQNLRFVYPGDQITGLRGQYII
jgi:hypothetical protein